MNRIVEASENEDDSTHSIDVSENDTERNRTLWDYHVSRDNHVEDAANNKVYDDEGDDDIVGLLLASAKKEPSSIAKPDSSLDDERVSRILQTDTVDLVDGWSEDEIDGESSDDPGEGEILDDRRALTTFRSASIDNGSIDDEIDDIDFQANKIGGRYSDMSNSSTEHIDARSTWFDDDEDVTDEQVTNCYGVVHVNLKQARNLLCPIHTQVQAVLRLIPWKGCVRLEKVTADFSSESVSVKWPTEALASMVHSYSEGSPFPTLKLDLLMVTPLFLEFKMASLSLDCKLLFRSPGTVRHQWFKTDKEPVVELQAWFEPSIETDELTTTHGESTGNLFLENVSVVRDRLPTKQSDHDMDSATQTTRMTSIHLLHHYSYRSTPAVCCVCQKSIFWSSGSLQCESCRVDCCQDCRLTVDVALPCGSEAALKAVEDAVQNRWTAESLLNVMAPVPLTRPITELEHSTPEPERGIGILCIEIGKAFVMQEAAPPDTAVSDLLSGARRFRAGDYYVRVSNQRTRTIQHSQGHPNFENHLIRIVVPHYGAEYRLDLIDGATDMIVGSTMLNTQLLLQQQRDVLVETLPFTSFCRPLSYSEMRPMRAQLRYYGSKEVTSVDFFSIPKQAVGDSDLARSGDIVGCIDIKACLEENWSGMFSMDPYECPARPGRDLDMGVFQLQIQRISLLVDDIKSFASSYAYVISWKDPFLTIFSLIFFLQFMYWMNPAYIGSVPVFVLITLMLHLAVRRMYGKLRQSFTRREIERKQKAESGTIDYELHRPIGKIRVRIRAGRNIRSPELGLPGNVGCRVYWNPGLNKDGKVADQATTSTHDLGTTGFVYSTSPLWGKIYPSENSKRLDILLPSSGAFFDGKHENEEDQGNELEFPFLQPIEKSNDMPFLTHWNSIPGSLVFEVQFSDLLNVLPNSVYSIGEVALPFRRLVDKGKLDGWFNVTENQAPEGLQVIPSPNSTKAEKPQISLEVVWVPPTSESNFPIEMQREASVAIQEELVRAALLTKQQKEKLSILGSSLGALNTVRGISTNLHLVQNSLSLVLDTVEGTIHLFDFTDPFKSIVIIGVLTLIWIVLSIVSTKVIMLALGLAQYGVTFNARFGAMLRQSQSKISGEVKARSDRQKGASLPLQTWVMNAIRGVPSSEDLRQTYFWDSRREGIKATEQRIADKRRARMKRLWRVQWYGPVRILGQDKTNNSLEWRVAFSLLHGRRLMWWRSVIDFDNGAPSLGQLVLSGHTGLSSPSPLELREIGARDIPRTLSIFGSGSRVTVLTQTEESKRELEEMVLAAAVHKAD